MDKILKQYLNELEKYRNPKNADNDFPFRELLGKIVKLQDPEAIPYLLDCLYDNDKRELASEELGGCIEVFEDKFYIPCLLEKIPHLLHNAKDECTYFFYHIFNTPESLFFLKQNIHLADKKAMIDLLDYMEKDEPLERHKPIIAELRRLVNEEKLVQDELF